MTKNEWEIGLPLHLAHVNRTVIIARVVVLMLSFQQCVRHFDKITDGFYAPLDL